MCPLPIGREDHHRALDHPVLLNFPSGGTCFPTRTTREEVLPDRRTISEAGASLGTTESATTARNKDTLKSIAENSKQKPTKLKERIRRVAGMKR